MNRAQDKVIGKYKQLAFDLNTRELEKYYPKENWRRAYEDIKKYMLENDFRWLQGSVYLSIKPMTDIQVRGIIDNLIEEKPWLTKCMRDCRETNIGREHDLTPLFHTEIDIPIRTKALEEERGLGDPPKFPISPSDEITTRRQGRNRRNDYER